jgi:tetratricopeptide (TPR) repeat protein
VQAERTVRAAIAIDPSDGEQGKGDRMRAYAVLAEIVERSGDGAQAKSLRDVVRAIRLSEEADDWWAAGLVSHALERYERSLAHFADAYCIQSRLALRFGERGEHAKAAAHYLRAFELMPESFGRMESHCFGCERAFSGGRAQSVAEEVFTRLALQTPEKAQVFYLLGHLREEQERYSDALEHYRRAVALDPDYFNAWKRISTLGDRFTVPAPDQKAASLNLLRLDPFGRHGAVDFGQSPDYRLVWAALAPSARIGPSRRKVFSLSAKKSDPAEQAYKRKGLQESERGNWPGAKLSRSTSLDLVALKLGIALRVD